MKKCLHCNEICEDSISICPKCGAMVDTYINNKEYMSVYHINQGKRLKNKKIILWFILGLILPYIGFIVSWVIFDGDKSKAKALLFGVIVSTIISTFLPYILFLFFNGDDSYSDGNKNDGSQQIKMLLEIYKGL